MLKTLGLIKNDSSWQAKITKDDIDSVIEALKSDFLTQGPMVLVFERNYQKFFYRQNSVTNNKK